MAKLIECIPNFSCSKEKDELEKYSSNFVAWVDVCKEKAPAPQA